MLFFRRLPAPSLAWIATVCLLAGAAPVAGQVGKAQLTEGDPNLAKVSSHLLRARALGRQGRTAAEIAGAVQILEYRDGLPQVTVRLRGATLDSLERLQKAGLVVDDFHLRWGRAYGRVDPANLRAIAALPEVVTVQPKGRRFTRGGSAINQADETMNADDVRSLFSLDGTGIEVGILSDSFNDFGGGTVSGSGCGRTVISTDSQDLGEIPGSSGDIKLLDDCTIGSPNCDVLSDEGRAIAELIFDIAPKVKFSFHSAFNSPADFADGITELRDCGANLIVDDVGWTGQAFFQDDVIAQAAQEVVDGEPGKPGVPYFSAAGNDATFGIDDLFLDSAVPDDMASPPTGDDFHDFDPGAGTDAFAEITLPDDCAIFAELQWAEPFESIGSGAGSSSDLDLYLLDDTSLPIVAGPPPGGDVFADSTSATGCGVPGPPSGDPVESLFFANTTGSPLSLFLAVENYCGDETVPFRIVTLTSGPGCTGIDFEDGEMSETPIFVDKQIWGHPAAKDVIATAATFYGEIFDPEGFPPGIINPPSGEFNVNTFSSLGGDIPFYFDTDGDPLPGAPEHRPKPNVTGPDGVNNSFFGVDSGFDSDSDPNFSGTSAAAPNSAAIAALILDLTELKINPLPLKQLLEQSAIDMEGPGFDDLSGFGFTDALRPIKSLDPSTTPLIDDLEFDLDGGAFFSSPPTGGQQRLQANGTIRYEDGDFSGLDAFADSHIFADGFESGDTSAWSSSTP